MIRFWVSGNPRAMSVGKSVSFKRGDTRHHFQKRNNSDWSLLVGQVGREHAPPAPLTGAVIFMATFWLPRPSSIPRREQATAMPIKRPDIDNLVHKLSDHFSGIFYMDDSQITDILVRKRYPLDGRVGVEIVVAPVTNAQVMAQLDQVALDMEPAHR